MLSRLCLQLLQCSCLALLLIQPTLSGTHLERWRKKLHHLSAIHIDNQKFSNIVGPLLDYEFLTPHSQLRRGIIYQGSNHRLRRTLRDLLSGQKSVKVGAVGGSVSWGQGATVRGVTDWFSVFSKWLVKAFPQTTVTARNGCVPGTPSSYMIMCLELSVDPDVDVVFVEYALNDGFENIISGNSKAMQYERLLRRIMSLPNNPAVILLQIPTHGMAKDYGDREYRPFYETLEDLYGAHAQYYDLQYLSLRTAAYRLAVFNKQPGFSWGELFTDHHPGDLGFHMMADLAVLLFQQTAIDLLVSPFGEEDVEHLADTLPEPMYHGNEAPRSAMCLHQDALKAVVVEASGFEFINEGTDEKPKKGYVATQPGSVLKVKVDTTRPHQGNIPVYFSYLRSYQHMGIATFGCVSGCSCEPRVIDAHQALPESQLYLVELEVGQSPECVVSITVQQKTSSGENKFKVSGVMLSEVTADSRERYADWREGQWGATLHVRPELQITYSKNGTKALPHDVE